MNIEHILEAIADQSDGATGIHLWKGEVHYDQQEFVMLKGVTLETTLLKVLEYAKLKKQFNTQLNRIKTGV